jgi:hypothetical protein
MKYLIIFLIITNESQACDQQTDNNKILQNRIDTLEKKLSDTYKPGFGEFMSSIQVHHSKLWFAGQNQNWKLADFEIHEIMEAIENIKNIKLKEETPPFSNQSFKVDTAK